MQLDVPRNQVLDPESVYTCQGCGCDAINTGDFPYCSYPCKVKHDERRSRPCEVCTALAWFYERGPDGLERWQCAHGHLLIVSPGTPERRIA